ncbi:MAG: RHS repeat-associated core domain-containing protein [Clostridia bacterium]|nr:RHS repeat-associated core domain-containing protein [Clostridia bacterium]
MNQLIREDNKQLNRSYLYRYDNAGNIILKDEHEYIYGEETATLSRKEYNYDDDGWKDKLISFGGQPITYDALGNPLSYLGHNLAWDRVRQLKTFDNNTFSYDGFGKRCRKNSVYYLYDGDKLIKERRNGTSLVYFYDTAGICGFRYHDFAGENDTTAYYFYLKNLQGDVTAILDENGNVVAEYLYDAWGKCTITYDPIGIGEINPIRYRSYYYDTETGLYYLNSRYYDPNTGRFINADIVITTKQGIIGYNLFSYCCNNPIQMVDNNGTNPSAGALWSSSMWWLCSADTVLPVGDLIYFGVWGILLIATVGTATESPSVAIPHFRLNKKEKAEENIDVTTNSLPMPDNSGKTYYHGTTLENAMSIISTGKMFGSAFEGGHVFAWEVFPSKRAILASGAHLEVIISFETSASFVMDTGVKDTIAKLYRPVVSSRPGPITVKNVYIVEFL